MMSVVVSHIVATVQVCLHLLLGHKDPWVVGSQFMPIQKCIRLVKKQNLVSQYNVLLLTMLQTAINVDVAHMYYKCASPCNMHITLFRKSEIVHKPNALYVYPNFSPNMNI